jgi:hypothetical protein
MAEKVKKFFTVKKKAKLAQETERWHSSENYTIQKKDRNVCKRL